MFEITFDIFYIKKYSKICNFYNVLFQFFKIKNAKI